MRSIAKWAIAAMVLFIAGLTLNYFSEPLLGYKEGLVGHNFSFNMMFFIPIMMSAVFISFIAVVDLIINWKKFNKNTKATVLSCGIPILFLFVFQIWNVFRNA